MSEQDLRLNKINSREFMLSPAVSSGNDRESSSKDFYQYTKNILYLGCLGVGMKVKHCQTEIPYTIVNFEKEKISRLNLQEKINSTLDLMYRSIHPYLFRLLNHYETEERIGLIFEPFEGDSLDNLIQRGKCDIQTSLKYFVEILIAVNHMNNLGLYNLNIRPENILVDESIKITDFGLKMTGKPEIPKRAKDMVTIGNRTIIIDAYFSPEEINSILNTKEKINLNSKLDSWKCGILLFEMLTNFKSPFSINNNDTNYISFENELINAIMKEEIDLSLINDNFCRDLISKLLKKNPKDRMDITEIFNIDFIKTINIEQRNIDLSDNIINPDNEEENEQNEDEHDADDKEVIIKKLVSENEFLRSELSKEKSSNKNFRFTQSTKTSKLGSEQKEKEESKKENIITYNKDKDLDINIDKDKINENINNDSFSEEDTLEEQSSSDDNINLENNPNIYDKYKTLKEKYMMIKTKHKNLKKIIKSLKEEKTTLEKEKKDILEQKTLDFLNNFEKINTSKITNISELSDIIINSINIFKESQNNLQNLIEKLIKISDNENKSLLEETKRYINDKGKVFFDTLKNLNENKIDSNEKNKEESKKLNMAKETEISELKKKYELSKQRETSLKEKIKVLEERQNMMESLNKNLMTTIDEMYTNYKGSDESKKKK
jgi:serine/threonine protein kinase